MSHPWYFCSYATPVYRTWDSSGVEREDVCLILIILTQFRGIILRFSASRAFLSRSHVRRGFSGMCQECETFNLVPFPSIWFHFHRRRRAMGAGGREVPGLARERRTYADIVAGGMSMGQWAFVAERTGRL